MPYIALIIVCAYSIVSYCLTRKAVFLTTGDKSVAPLVGGRAGRWGQLERLHGNHPLVFHFERLLGLLLAYSSFVTTNFALLTIALSLVLSPLLARFGWEQRPIAFLASLPLLFVVLAFGSMGLGFVGIQGFTMPFFALHF